MWDLCILDNEQQTDLRDPECRLDVDEAVPVMDDDFCEEGVSVDVEEDVVSSVIHRSLKNDCGI